MALSGIHKNLRLFGSYLKYLKNIITSVKWFHRKITFTKLKLLKNLFRITFFFVTVHQPISPKQL